MLLCLLFRRFGWLIAGFIENCLKMIDLFQYVYFLYGQKPNVVKRRDLWSVAVLLCCGKPAECAPPG